MILIDIMETLPDLFYLPEAAWFREHTFTEVDNGHIMAMPDHLAPCNPADPRRGIDLFGFVPFASALALLYVATPDDSLWRKFLWTQDKDDYGQRIYVGGVGMFGIEQFQIHRHLEINENWVMPIWSKGV